MGLKKMINNVQTCKLCAAEITDVEPVEIQGVIYPSVGICDDCDLNRVEAEKAARRIRDISEIRQSEFEEVCPKLFLLADPATLPCDNGQTHLSHPDFPKRLYVAVSSWQHGAKGLGICGTTGKAKTRIMWLLIHRLWMDGVKTAATTSVELQLAIQNQYRDEDCKTRLAEFRSSAILFIDDVGTEKLTDTVDGQFMDLLDYRMKNMLPVLWTTNYGLDAMKSKWPEPMLRRLTQFCQIIPSS